MLAATQWNNAGVDYIYTDTIDYNDAMQACIQNIEKPGMQRNFKDAAAARARNDPENSQILASYAEANKTTGGEKSGGNRMGVGYGYAGLVLAVGMGAVVGMFWGVCKEGISFPVVDDVFVDMGSEFDTEDVH